MKNYVLYYEQTSPLDVPLYFEWAKTRQIYANATDIRCISRIFSSLFFDLQ